MACPARTLPRCPFDWKIIYEEFCTFYNRLASIHAWKYSPPPTYSPEQKRQLVNQSNWLRITEYWLDSLGLNGGRNMKWSRPALKSGWRAVDEGVYSRAKVKSVVVLNIIPPRPNSALRRRLDGLNGSDRPLCWLSGESATFSLRGG